MKQVLGEYVISSVLSHGSKDLKWRASVTALLQLSFTWQAKDSSLLRHEGRLIQKERPQSILASSFYSFVSSRLSRTYANWANQEAGVLDSPEGLTPVCRFSFVSFLQAFPFLCLLGIAILDSFFLF